MNADSEFPKFTVVFFVTFPQTFEIAFHLHCRQNHVYRVCDVFLRNTARTHIRVADCFNGLKFVFCGYLVEIYKNLV